MEQINYLCWAIGETGEKGTEPFIQIFWAYHEAWESKSDDPTLQVTWCDPNAPVLSNMESCQTGSQKQIQNAGVNHTDWRLILLLSGADKPYKLRYLSGEKQITYCMKRGLLGKAAHPCQGHGDNENRTAKFNSKMTCKRVTSNLLSGTWSQ